MRIDEAIQQPGQRERLLKNDIMKSVHVAIPGEVVSYDTAKRTAVIQPVIREWKSKENPPLLLDVPVFFWGNYTFTPQRGDGCLVVCADSCIDSWMQSGGVSTPVVARNHSLSDGFAFVGFRQSGGVDLGNKLTEMSGKITQLETDLPKKADKVTGATENNFVAFDNHGNIKDSGKKASDFLTSADIANKKDKQNAVSDPTADGTGIDFLDAITQNANGVISPHKKTVRTVSKGNAGLCPALPDEDATTKYLRQDGSWVVPPDTQYTFTDKNATLAWSTQKVIATIGGVDIHVTLPANPNKNTWRGYQVKSYTYDYTGLAAGATLDITANQLKDSNGAVVSTPSGYTPVAVRNVQSGSSYVDVIAFRSHLLTTNWLIRLYNHSSSARGGTASIGILYLQTGSP